MPVYDLQMEDSFLTQESQMCVLEAESTLKFSLLQYH